jgi:4a-hydroxytetrahydrobiopterin dehydratase
VVYVAQSRLAEAHGTHRAVLARDLYSYLHLPMVAGVVLFALGVKTTLAHLHYELDIISAVGLNGGLALYFAAHVALRLRIGGGWAMGARPPPGRRGSLNGSREVDMSEQGWRAFLAADGVDDWVVLHGGPTAVYRVDSHLEAAQLAQAIAAVPGLLPRTILTIAKDRVTVRLTREMWAIEPQHIELARAISAVAHSRGAPPDRGAVQEVQLAISAKPEATDIGFWRAVLGYAPMADDNAIDPLGQGSTVWMQDLNPEKSLRHAMHIDVSVAREHAEARLTAALAAGGQVIDDSEAPASWTLSDRSGNKVDIAAWPDGATPAAQASDA